MNILKSGYDTLIFTTQEFYITESQIDDLQLAKCIAEDKGEKTSFFLNSCDDSRSYQFLMYPRNLRGYQYLFCDIDEKYLISINTNENRYILKVHLSSKVLFEKKIDEIIRELDRILINFFTVQNIYDMKISRIDYHVDFKAEKGTLEDFIRENEFQSRYKMTASIYSYQNHRKEQKQSSYNAKSGQIYFRTYNKALELFEKFNENPRKSSLMLKNYLDIEVNEQNIELQKIQYENSEIEIIRIEYQMQKDYIKNKFKVVSDLLEHNIKDLVLKTFLNHTGLKPLNFQEVEEEKKNQRNITSEDRKTYLELDYNYSGLAKAYFEFLKDKAEVYFNKYKRVQGEVYQAIAYNFMKLKANLLNLYVAMSKRDNENKTYDSFMKEVFESQEISERFEYYLEKKKANKFNIKTILDKFNLDFIDYDRKNKKQYRAFEDLEYKFDNLKATQLSF